MYLLCQELSDVTEYENVERDRREQYYVRETFKRMLRVPFLEKKLRVKILVCSPRKFLCKIIPSLNNIQGNIYLLCTLRLLPTISRAEHLL